MKNKIVDIFELRDIPKIGPISIKKLEDEGINSKTEMIVRSWTEISAITGMTKDEAETAVQYCRDTLQAAGLLWQTKMSAWELYQKRKQLRYWSTGSKALDMLIGGGIESRAITEISGEFRTGKTQIALSLCVEVCMADQIVPGIPNRVLFIDTEDTFRPERVEQILLARDPNANVQELLENIIIQRPMDAAHQTIIMENAMGLMREINIQAVIIDSGTALFRQGTGEYGQQGIKRVALNKMVHLMKNAAEVYDIPIVALNQVYDSTDPFKPGQKIYGGNVWGHAMTYRLGVKKKGRAWVATTIDYPHIAKADAMFDITEAGIVDIKKKKSEKSTESEIPPTESSDEIKKKEREAEERDVKEHEARIRKNVEVQKEKIEKDVDKMTKEEIEEMKKPKEIKK